jgi:4-diphosphocytidyl-2-C-methyl-D-erythritol kinase
MIVFPNAKINIGLRITERRRDNFHNIESVFYPIKLSDIIEFVESDSETQFTQSGIFLDTEPQKNLVLKAYKILKDNFNLPELKIHLHKMIPAGAGLGGGSADAAYMLKSLNDWFKLNLTENEMLKFAQQLGSDCPFFIKNKVVFAQGTGNIFSPINLDLSTYYLLLIKPDIHISTKEAFAEIIPKKSTVSLLNLINEPIDKWKNIIVNDFEKKLFIKYPILNEIKTNLYEMNAVYAQMSGSGSTIYGIFNFQPEIPKNLKTHFTFLRKF